MLDIEAPMAKETYAIYDNVQQSPNTELWHTQHANTYKLSSQNAKKDLYGFTQPHLRS